MTTAIDLQPLYQHTTVQPRPYQERIIKRAVGYFAQQGLRSVLIESPTGSGKTIMGLLVAKALQDQFGLRVGWVAMRRYLLTQARAENESKRIGAEITFLSMFDKDPPTGLDLLIVDEAQHDSASSMAQLHQAIAPRFILGLSATPYRSDRVKLCFDTIIRDAGIQTLIQDGHLSPYHHYTIPSYTPKLVVEHYLNDRSRWGQSILYFHTVEQCAAADELLRAAGVRSAVVTASSDRDDQLDAFRCGQLEVLSNCMVLSEGFDCPELHTVFCRPSCKGVTIQMCGRVLRKHPSVAVKNVVQCGKTRWPFVRTASAAVQFTWQARQWRSLQANPCLNQVAGRTLCALAQIETALPKFLSRHAAKRDRLRRNEE